MLTRKKYLTKEEEIFMDLEFKFSDNNCIPDTIFEKKVLYVKCRIPEEVVVKKKSNLGVQEPPQYGLFVTKKFKKDDIIWSSYMNVCDLGKNLPCDAMLNISDEGYIPVTFNEHMLRVANIGMYFSYNCLMNHSCDPSTMAICTMSPDKDAQLPFRYLYDQIALRDMVAGDEITCNYLLYNETVNDFNGFACSCGSKNCFGYIGGFDNLPPEKQKELAPERDKFRHIWQHFFNYAEKNT